MPAVQGQAKFAIKSLIDPTAVLDFGLFVLLAHELLRLVNKVFYFINRRFPLLFAARLEFLERVSSFRRGNDWRASREKLTTLHYISWGANHEWGHGLTSKLA